MTVKVGRFAKVTLGATLVSQIGSYTLSGFSVDPIEFTSFGDEAKNFVPGMGDPGEGTFSGYYDPDDATGQVALRTACAAGTEYGPGDIRFYIDASQYLTPKTGGIAIVTKVDAISMDKAGVGTNEFSVKFSAAGLELLAD